MSLGFWKAPIILSFGSLNCTLYGNADISWWLEWKRQHSAVVETWVDPPDSEEDAKIIPSLMVILGLMIVMMMIMTMTMLMTLIYLSLYLFIYLITDGTAHSDLRSHYNKHLLVNANKNIKIRVLILFTFLSLSRLWLLCILYNTKLVL